MHAVIKNRDWQIEPPKHVKCFRERIFLAGMTRNIVWSVTVYVRATVHIVRKVHMLCRNISLQEAAWLLKRVVRQFIGVSSSERAIASILAPNAFLLKVASSSLRHYVGDEPD